MKLADPGLICRPMTGDDVQAVSALVTAVFRARLAQRCPARGRQEFLFFAQAQELANRVTAGNRVFVAVEGGEIVGMIEVRAGHHIVLLFVAIERQRRGVGRALMEAAFPEFAQGRPLHMTVHAAPGAEPAYRRFGFVPSGPPQLRNGLPFLPMVRESA